MESLEFRLKLHLPHADVLNEWCTRFKQGSRSSSERIAALFFEPDIGERKHVGVKMENWPAREKCICEKRERGRGAA